MATQKNDEILKLIEVNVLTGEITEREFTVEETAERKALQAEVQAAQTAQEAKAAARESALSKLAELGLTAEEIAAL